VPPARFRSSRPVTKKRSSPVASTPVTLVVCWYFEAGPFCQPDRDPGTAA
jgi:hypothetical protein